MIHVSYCRVMAQYNAWMNEKLFAECARLSAEERLRPRGAFFGSIQATLEHIALVDRMFLDHFERDAPVSPPSAPPERAFEQLRQERTELDARLSAWSAAVSGAWLEQPSEHRHHGDGQPRQLTRGFWVVHLFNHQIHHRGQVTTLLSQLGIDVGSTDLHMSPLA